VRLGKGRQIGNFISTDLDDGKLPFESQPLRWPPDTDPPNWFESFRKEQWKFCAPIVSPSELADKGYVSERILPIISKEKLRGGASADVFKIALEESHNELRPKGCSQKVNMIILSSFLV